LNSARKLGIFRIRPDEKYFEFFKEIPVETIVRWRLFVETTDLAELGQSHAGTREFHCKNPLIFGP
jgi:hypothetical protein